MEFLQKKDKLNKTKKQLTRSAWRQRFIDGPVID